MTRTTKLNNIITTGIDMTCGDMTCGDMTCGDMTCHVPTYRPKIFFEKMYHLLRFPGLMNKKMKYNPRCHHRKSTRLKGYDYSKTALYFITICTKGRECFFGNIIDEKMILNDVGKIASDYLTEIPCHFPWVDIGESVIMPNHVHFILQLGHGGGRDTTCRVPTTNHFSKPVSGSVPVIIQQYKSSVKRWTNKNDCNYFNWQSRFYDRIIWNEKSFRNICDYIINNPGKWNDDNLFMK